MSNLTDQIDTLKSNLEDLEGLAESYVDLSDFTFPEGFDEDNDGLEQLIDAYNDQDQTIAQLGDLDADDIRVKLKRVECDSVRVVFDELEKMQRLIGGTPRYAGAQGTLVKVTPVTADDLEEEMKRIGLEPGIAGVMGANGRTMALYDWLQTLPEGAARTWLVAKEGPMQDVLVKAPVKGGSRGDGMAAVMIEAKLQPSPPPPVSTGPEVPAGFVAISNEEWQRLQDIAERAQRDSVIALAEANRLARAYFDAEYPPAVAGPSPRPTAEPILPAPNIY